MDLDTVRQFIGVDPDLQNLEEDDAGEVEKLMSAASEWPARPTNAAPEGEVGPDSDESEGDGKDDFCEDTQRVESTCAHQILTQFSDCHWYDWVSLLVALLCSLATGFLGPFATTITTQPINSVLAFEELARNSTLNQSDLDQNAIILLESNADILYLCLLVSGAQFTLHTVCMYLFGLFATRTTNAVRQRYVEAILRMDIAHSHETSAGQVSDMLDEHLNKVSDALENNLPQAITLIFEFMFSILISIMILWSISRFLIIMVILFIMIYYAGVKYCVRMVYIEQTHISKAAQIANECLAAIKTVLCLNAQEYTINKYNCQISLAMRASRKRAIASACVDACKQMICDSFFIVILMLGALQRDPSIVANLFAVWSLCYHITRNMQMFNMHIKAIYMAVVCAQKLKHVLHTVELICLAIAYVPDIKEVIRFEHVSFSYPSRPDVEVLDDICLEIGAGQKVAIVGESGCGKSTIVKLIMRFFEPRYGKITIDGNPVNELDIGSLRSLTGFVSQEPSLFNMSLRENLTCVSETATIEQIEWALHQANATEFVSKLPNGLDTQVGGGGSQLSVGQKQRVCIARALITQPQLLIFDEASSSLDTQSQLAVEQAIDKASYGRTTIIITHRLSSVLSADRIFVLKEGRIVEFGLPQDLREMENGYFKSLYEQQNHSYKEQRRLSTQSDSSDSELHLQKRQGKRISAVEEAVETVALNYVPKASGLKSSVAKVVTLHKNSNLLLFALFASAVRASTFVFKDLLDALAFDAFSYPPDQIVPRVFYLCVIAGVVLVAFMVAELALFITISKYADELGAVIRTKLLAHFMNQELYYFDINPSGALGATLATHPANIRETLSTKIPELLTGVFVSLFAGVTSFVIDPLLTIICLVIVFSTTLLQSIETAVLTSKERKLQPRQAEAATELSGAVRLEDVGFSYPSRPDNRVLEKISLSVKAGQRVAIVGPSGSGKSTIFQLILALYKTDEGSITASDVDVDSIDPTHLRTSIVSVSQEPSFFSASVFENIIYGLEGDVDIERVYDAARRANIHHFILSLPQGYSTELGPQGGRLSGGQRQRLAMARALVRKPKLLLLDETTSALDANTETAVLLGLAESKCASITIAHRLATVRDAHKIFVVQDGRIVERGLWIVSGLFEDEILGTDTQLRRRNGLYHTMSLSKGVGDDL